MKLNFLTIGALLVAPFAFAEEPAPASETAPAAPAAQAAPAAPAAPAVPEAWAYMTRLEGHWEGPATITMGGKDHKVTYIVDFRKTADGAGLYMDETFTDPELGTLKGANLIGYNGNDKRIHWLSVDNFGTSHEHLGDWKTTDHFIMEVKEVQGKKPFKERINLVLHDNDHLYLDIVATLDGKVIETGSAEFIRGAPPTPVP